MAFLRPRSTLSRLAKLPLQAQDLTTLHQTRDFRQQLLAAIAGAKQRIYLTSLYLEHDEAGQEVLDALFAAKQARPELDICICVDWHRAQRGRIGESKTACNASWYSEQAQQHPDVDIPIYGIPVQTRELFGVLHLKGFMIDDLVLYSGASINNVYLHKQDKYRFDRYHLIHSAALANTLCHYIRQQFIGDPAVFRLDQTKPATRGIRKEIRLFRDKLSRSQYQPPALPLADAPLSMSPIVGLGKKSRLNQVILDLITQTQTRLFICTPYFNLPRSVLVAVNRALRRGVQVDIVVGDKTANDFFIPSDQPFRVISALPYLYETNLRRFVKRQRYFVEQNQLRVHLWKDQDNTYHLKGMWCDDQYMLLTGNNLNPRAFRLDMENGLLIHDPQAKLTTQNTAEQANILHHTRLVQHYKQLDDVASYPEQVKKLLTRLSRVRIDRMLNLIL